MSKINNWTNEKTINFINEIQLHPAVWDVESCAYKNRYLKKDAWALIAKNFGISSDEAYKKLRSLRTYAKNEVKKKKSGSAGGRRSTWFAFDAISFLLARDTPDTGVDSESISEIDEAENLEDKLEKPENTNDSHLPEDFAVPTNVPFKKKRAKIADTTFEKAVNIINEASGKKKSKYSAFGEHIANKLMTYDMSTRAHVEFSMSKILFEADMKMLNGKPTAPLPTNIQESPSQASLSGYLGQSCPSSTCTDVLDTSWTKVHQLANGNEQNLSEKAYGANIMYEEIALQTLE